jgi:Amt family ammonium transporter
MSAIAIGAIAAVPSYFMLNWRAHTGLDDSLDVVAAHGVGGTVGALLTGVFAIDGGSVGVQAVAVLAAAVYSGVATFILLKLIGLVLPLRVSDDDEGAGLDISQHSEEAYLRLAGSRSGN